MTKDAITVKNSFDDDYVSNHIKASKMYLNLAKRYSNIEFEEKPQSIQDIFDSAIFGEILEKADETQIDDFLATRLLVSAIFEVTGRNKLIAQLSDKHEKTMSTKKYLKAAKYLVSTISDDEIASQRLSTTLDVLSSVYEEQNVQVTNDGIWLVDSLIQDPKPNTKKLLNICENIDERCSEISHITAYLPQFDSYKNFFIDTANVRTCADDSLVSTNAYQFWGMKNDAIIKLALKDKDLYADDFDDENGEYTDAILDGIFMANSNNSITINVNVTSAKKAKKAVDDIVTQYTGGETDDKSSEKKEKFKKFKKEKECSMDTLEKILHLDKQSK